MYEYLNLFFPITVFLVQAKLNPGRAPPKKRCLQPIHEPKQKEHEHFTQTEAERTCTGVVDEPVLPVQKFDVGVQWPDIGEHSYSSTNKRSRTCSTQTDPALAMSAHDMDDKDAKFFTGLSKDVFWGFIAAVVALISHPMKFKMAVPNQILLVLMRLRLGLMFTDLGKRFGISQTTACEIFATWIPHMARFMKLNSILWLPRDTLKRIRPRSFADCYPRATCIIDCTEIFVQRPNHLKQRAQTFSNYKHHNTYKVLYCIAPNGYVMFVSKLFGGRASDVFISRNSGFTEQVLPGDEVLADRGFTINDILPHGVKLAIPAFTKGLKELPERAVTEMRRLANVRIHVERAIRRLKCFKILSNVIPGRVQNVDDIVTVCAGLCNFQPQLIQETIEEKEEPMDIDEDGDIEAEGDMYMSVIAEE